MKSEIEISNNWDFKDDPKYRRDIIFYWGVGFLTGAFLVICLTVVLYNVIDPDCIAGKMCTVHNHKVK